MLQNSPSSVKLLTPLSISISFVRSRSQPGAMSSPSSNSHHHHHHHQQHHGGNSHRSTLGSTTVQAVRSSLPGGATLTPGGSSSRSSNYGSQRTGSNLSITPSVTITPTSAPPGKSRHVSQIGNQYTMWGCNGALVVMCPYCVCPYSCPAWVRARCRCPIRCRSHRRRRRTTVRPIKCPRRRYVYDSIVIGKYVFLLNSSFVMFARRSNVSRHATSSRPPSDRRPPNWRCANNWRKLCCRFRHPSRRHRRCTSFRIRATRSSCICSAWRRSSTTSPRTRS